MSAYTYPGVYVEEIPSGVRPITGVSTSNTAFVGFFGRGPLNEAIRCNKYGDFERVFGGLDARSETSYGVKQYFLNGGAVAFVVRVAVDLPDDPESRVAMPDAADVNQVAFTVVASSPGQWGDTLRVGVVDGPADTFALSIREYDGDRLVSETRFENLTTAVGANNVATVVNANSGLVDVIDVQAGTSPTTSVALAVAAATAAQTMLDAAADANAAAETARDNAADELVGLAEAVDVAIDDHVQAQPEVAAAITDRAAALEAHVTAQAAFIDGLTLLEVQAADDAEADYVAATDAWVTDAGLDGQNYVANQVTPAQDAAANLFGDGPLFSDDNVRAARAAGADVVVNPGLPPALGGPGLRQTYVDAATELRATVVTLLAARSLQRSVMASDPAVIAAADESDVADARLEQARIDALAEAQELPAVIDARNELADGQVALASAESTLAQAASAVAPATEALRRATRAADIRDLDDLTLGALYALGGGSDGAEPGTPAWVDNASTAIAGEQNAASGLWALDSIAPDVFNLMCIPDAAGLSAIGSLAAYDEAAVFCEAKRAFLLVDPPPGPPNKREALNAVLGWGGVVSKNAALNFPGLVLGDALNNNVPTRRTASGTMAGVYARTDADRGVWKAPAGTDAALRGNGLALEHVLNDPENGQLNTAGINALRNFRLYNNIGWGARTTVGANAMASEWKYVPVRRTALFIEESLYQGLKWVVFEPNDEPLWASIRLNVTAFMHDLFRRKAFQGSSPRDAYLVKCDAETTTQADINNGIVNIVVGFAPLVPAEFVVIQLTQLAGQSQI